MTANSPEWGNADVLGTAVKDLHVSLTEGEVSKRGQSLAVQLGTVAKMEAAHKEALKVLKAAHKKEMGEATARLYALGTAVNERREPRPVTVVYLADFGKGIHMTLREDSSEIIKTRALEPHERQLQLPIPLRVVADNTGRLKRSDGSSLNTLPFVRQEHCGNAICRECASRHNTEHEEGCDLRGDGDDRMVNGDQVEDRVCQTCSAPLNSHHADGCKHLGEGE